MTEVLRLAIASVESGKYAQNLGGALRRKRRVDPGKARRIEALIVQPSAYIATEQSNFERFRHVDTRILQQHLLGAKRDDRCPRCCRHRHLQFRG